MAISTLHAAVFMLLALACTASAQSMASCPAKFRFQWFYKLKEPTAANLKAMDGVVMKWMREDCGKVMFFGQGPAASTTGAVYGLATPSPTNDFADYGAWSDWASLDDIKSCYEMGLKSGNVAAIRKYAAKASRVIYPLLSCPTISNAPATLRYMFNYKLADFSPATCTKAVDLQGKITSSLRALRHGNGCDALNGDTKVFGTNVPVTADYGGFVDFKNAQDMTTYLSSKDPQAAAARKEIRTLGASVTRVAIALPGSSFKGGEAAKVAKERAQLP